MKRELQTIMLLLSCVTSLRADTCQPSVSPHPGWPQFRGPARDGIVQAGDLLQSWPQGGPKQIWKTNGLGQGWSAPILVEGAIYVAGDVGDECRISAFDRSGQHTWTAVNGQAWKASYPGARAACTYFKGSLFHMNAHGRVVCLEPVTGRERWAVDVLQRFKAPNIKWAISECLLIDRDEVIVTPGGPGTLMAALDYRTGATVWQTEPLRFTRTHKFGGKPVELPHADTDKAGYASPIAFTLGGKRLICGSSARHLFCVDADKRKLVWTHPVFARWEVIGSMPVTWRDSVFFSAPDDFGGKLFRLSVQTGQLIVTELWQVPLDSCHGSAVVVGNTLYGSGHRQHKPWTCIDLETGTVGYTREDIQKGAVIFADGRLYALAENGVLALLNPTGDGFEVCGEIRLTDGAAKDVWTHPVIVDGHLYLRYHDTLWCYDIRR